MAQTARAGGEPCSGPGLEAPALVSGLDDVAVVGEPVGQRGRHLGVAEYGGPFAEVEVRRDNHRRTFVEAADQVEQELAAGLGEGEIAEFVEDQEVEAAQEVGRPALKMKAWMVSMLTARRPISIPRRSQPAICSGVQPSAIRSTTKPRRATSVSRMAALWRRNRYEPSTKTGR